MSIATIASGHAKYAGRPRLWAATRRYRPVLGLNAAMILIFALWQPVFATRANVESMLTASSILWVVALGMTFVLISGGFDLSAGAVAAVSGIVLAELLKVMPGAAALAATVLVGAVIGALLNGFFVGVMRLSVFVVTLATMTALGGVAMLWTNTQTLPVASDAVDFLIIGRFFTVPIAVWLMFVALAIALYVQERTHLGRDVYAVGGSEKAARLSGVHTARVLVMVYAGLGACAALAGVLAAGRIGGAAPQPDSTLALQAIAAVLLGGTTLAGGNGNVVGTVLGVLFIAILQNGLSLSGVQSFWQQIITGLILIGAVLGDQIDMPASIRRARAALHRNPSA